MGPKDSSAEAGGGSKALHVLLSWALATRLPPEWPVPVGPHTAGLRPSALTRCIPCGPLAPSDHGLFGFGQKSEGANAERQRYPLLRLSDILKATEDYLRPLLSPLHSPEPRSHAGRSLGIGLSSAHPVGLSHTPLPLLPLPRDTLCTPRMPAPQNARLCPICRLPLGRSPAPLTPSAGVWAGQQGEGLAVDVFLAGKQQRGWAWDPRGWAAVSEGPEPARWRLRAAPRPPLVGHWLR